MRAGVNADSFGFGKEGGGASSVWMLGLLIVLSFYYNSISILELKIETKCFIKCNKMIHYQRIGLS